MLCFRYVNDILTQTTPLLVSDEGVQSYEYIDEAVSIYLTTAAV